MALSIPNFIPLLAPLNSATNSGPYSVAGILAALLGIFLFVTTRKSNFERIGKPWLLSLLSGRNAMTFTIEKHVQDGYAKVIKQTGKPFVMKWWAIDYVFLPPKYLRDLKRASTQSLSFFENISEAFSLDASVGHLYRSELMINVVKRGINTRLPKLIPLLNEECDYSFMKEIGSPTDWKQYSAATLFGDIMHRTTSRVLIGSELCRDETYLNSSKTLANSIFVNGLIMTMLPLGHFRRVACYLLSVFHRINIRRAMRVILPVVEQRFNEFQTQLDSAKDGEERLDAIEWSLDLSRGDINEHNPQWIALSLLHNLWAGSAAPGGLVTQMVFQVLLEPQYLEPLRTEAENAFRAHGYTDIALSSMILMDSFIRELNRLHPTGAITCARTVMDPLGFQFHDGLMLPQGSRIAIPALAIQTDAQNFQDPLTFDGFRFARLNATTEEEGSEDGEHKWGASTLSETNLAFGFGKHACIGRFYAVRKAKLIFSKLIMEYDLKWEGVNLRPASLSVNGQFAPNQSQKIFLKKREVNVKSKDGQGYK
ncbi:putative cytochrome P450 monooxygenase [Hypoxylon cercidicola]|nr:putative cytochrome P450 monooxygenase [Hypoxylon cercidicola]